MSKYDLTIAYDGPALQDGTMDVSELAPALLAFGNLLEEANRELNGSDSTMKVLVKTGFKTGSFHVDFEIVRTLGAQISLLWNKVSVMSVGEILAAIGLVSTLSGVSLLELFRLIRNRKIKKGTAIEQGNVRIEFEDDSKPVIVEKGVYQLFINLNIQTAVQNILKPLDNEGIDKFLTQKDGSIQNKITKAEVNFYRTPDITKTTLEAEIISENVNRSAYKIVTASFEEGYKWRLTNGQDKITAILNDSVFIRKIDNNEISLSKEDLLVVDMKTTQWHTRDGNIKTENEIVKVIEHRRMHSQLAIPFYEENNE